MGDSEPACRIYKEPSQLGKKNGKIKEGTADPPKIGGHLTKKV